MHSNAGESETGLRCQTFFQVIRQDFVRIRFLERFRQTTRFDDFSLIEQNRHFIQPVLDGSLHGTVFLGHGAMGSALRAGLATRLRCRSHGMGGDISAASCGFKASAAGAETGD